MPHEFENEYHRRIYEFLVEFYGEENVETNKYLPKPYRFCDLWVEGPLFPLAIEVENDFEAAIKGVGQSLIYSHEAPNAVPVVIVPPDHVEHPEVDALRRRVPVVELDV